MKSRNFRLGIFCDEFSENTFIFKSEDKVFARADFVNDKWHVWFYTKHIQISYESLREAIVGINRRFLSEYSGIMYEIHKRASR